MLKSYCRFEITLTFNVLKNISYLKHKVNIMIQFSSRKKKYIVAIVVDSMIAILACMLLVCQGKDIKMFRFGTSKLFCNPTLVYMLYLMLWPNFGLAPYSDHVICRHTVMTTVNKCHIYFVDFVSFCIWTYMDRNI